MNKKLASVRDVIAALGGTGKAADFLEVGPSAVSNMLFDDEIRRAYHNRIRVRLEASGYEIDQLELGWIKPGDLGPQSSMPAE